MKINLICLLALACPVLSTSVAQAAAEQDRVSAVIELQDAYVASLKQTGFIKMAIPPHLSDRVDSVILKRPVRFKDESAILFNDVDRRNGTVAVQIDDSTMEQIDYQPVELKIYESGFSSIVVQYRPGNSTPSRKATKDDSAVFVTNLDNAKTLTGRIADMKEFTIKSGLGKIDVDLDDVSQITFEDDGRASVQLENGDKLSGKIAFRNITINSRWGLEDLAVADIVSISKPASAATTAPSASVMMPSMPMEPVDMATPMSADSNSMPMAIPQQISIPQPMMQQPVYSPLQSHLHPMSNAYVPNGQRIDSVPAPLNQPIGQGYDPYTGQQIFDQAVDQLMQPFDASMQPVEMMPMDQNFGPFFGESILMGESMLMDESMLIGEHPIGSLGDMIQNPQPIEQGQPLPQNGTPEAGSDFWFFPQ